MPSSSIAAANKQIHDLLQGEEATSKSGKRGHRFKRELAHCTQAIWIVLSSYLHLIRWLNSDRSRSRGQKGHCRCGSCACQRYSARHQSSKSLPAKSSYTGNAIILLFYITKSRWLLKFSCTTIILDSLMFLDEGCNLYNCLCALYCTLQIGVKNWVDISEYPSLINTFSSQ